MVETRARARQSASQSALRSEPKVATVPSSDTPQLDALIKELGAEEAQEKSKRRGTLLKLQEWYSLLLLRSGGTLLTPLERSLYGLVIGAIFVLVSMGVSNAANFYARVLARSVLGPN